MSPNKNDAALAVELPKSPIRLADTELIKRIVNKEAKKINPCFFLFMLL
jgi:hypothetical protein